MGAKDPLWDNRTGAHSLWNYDVQLILRIPGVPSGGGMTANRTRWLAGCALIAYVAILIRLVVFKAIPVVRIGHLRLKLAGPHTGPANFVPFKTIAPQLIGQGNRLIDMDEPNWEHLPVYADRISRSTCFSIHLMAEDARPWSCHRA